MKHITIKVSADGKQAHLIPDAGYMLQRGINPQMYSDARVKNDPQELSLWNAVKVGQYKGYIMERSLD